MRLLLLATMLVFNVFPQVAKTVAVVMLISPSEFTHLRRYKFIVHFITQKWCSGFKNRQSRKTKQKYGYCFLHRAKITIKKTNYSYKKLKTAKINDGGALPFHDDVNYKVHIQILRLNDEYQNHHGEFF